jgi:arylsulfatase
LSFDSGQRAARAFGRRDALRLGALLLIFLLSRVLWVLVHPETSSYWEESYRWVAAQEWRSGALLPWLDYQADHYQGGSLVMIGLTALAFALAGPSALALKTPALLFSGSILAATYVVVRRSFGPRAATIAAGTLVAGPALVAYWGLSPMGSHAESALFGWLQFALFLRLLEAEPRRLGSWLGFGFVAGLGVWFCMTSGLATLACVVTWLLVARPPRAREWGTAIAGGALGLLPWLVYNLRLGFVGLQRPLQILGLREPIDPWPEPSAWEKGFDLFAQVIPVSLLDPSGAALPGWLQAVCSVGFVAVLGVAFFSALGPARAAIFAPRSGALTPDQERCRAELLFVVYGVVFVPSYLVSSYVVEPGLTVSARMFTPFALLCLLPIVAIRIADAWSRGLWPGKLGLAVFWASLAITTTGFALRSNQTHPLGEQIGAQARGALLQRKHGTEIEPAYALVRRIADPGLRNATLEGIGFGLVTEFMAGDSLSPVEAWLERATPEERNLVASGARWMATVEIGVRTPKSQADPTAQRRVARLHEFVDWLGGIATVSGSPVTAASSLPPVVLVTLDTTRVDHLSPYGYARATTPALQAFAEAAVRFDRAWSTSSWTLPAHASLFTGLYPARHGAHFDAQGEARLGDVVGMPITKFVRAGLLAPTHTTLAEKLRDAGYATGAFVAGPWLHRSFGLLQGFAHRDDPVTSFAGRPAEAVTDAAIAWLADAPERYFLFVNYFDPHAPYTPTPGYDDLPHAKEPFDLPFEAIIRKERELSEAERQIVIDRYDGEIRYMDHHLGRLLAAVEARSGVRPLIVVTADHGESFGEEGRIGHSLWLSEELTRVPLLVRYPDGRDAGGVESRPVQLVDVLPLVMAELGLEPDPALDGKAAGEREWVISELTREPTSVARFGEGFDRDLEAIVEWPYKLVRETRGEATLYELAETGVVERVHDDPALEARLLAALEARAASLERAPVAPVGEVDPEMLEALRRLGYVD